MVLKVWPLDRQQRHPGTGDNADSEAPKPSELENLVEQALQGTVMPVGSETHRPRPLHTTYPTVHHA